MIVPVIEDWIKKARQPNDVEIVVTTDGPDQKCKTLMEQIPPTSRIKWHVQPDPPFNCNRGWNLAAAKATGKVLIAISDDFLAPQRVDVGAAVAELGQHLLGMLAQLGRRCERIVRRRKRLRRRLEGCGLRRRLHNRR